MSTESFLPPTVMETQLFTLQFGQAIINSSMLSLKSVIVPHFNSVIIVKKIPCILHVKSVIVYYFKS